MQIIGDLVEHKPKGAWSDIVRTYQPRTARSLGTTKAATSAASQESGDAEELTWSEFIERLDRVSPEIFAQKSCDDFAKWGPRVARVLPFALTNL